MQLAFDIDDIPLVLEAAGAAGRVVDDPIDLYPTWQVQKQIADASGDPDLAAAVLEARRRMLAYLPAGRVFRRGLELNVLAKTSSCSSWGRPILLATVHPPANDWPSVRRPINGSALTRHSVP
jgi:hypothetical protein